jgi:protoporphyrinogen oxidase
LTVAIVVFGVGQLVLPPIATHIARSRLAKYGTVQSVSVSAFPAIKLLFGDADSVKVKMAGFRAPQAQLADQLSQAKGLGKVKVAIGDVVSGLVKITNVTMTKDGDQFTASGQISEASLRSAVPLLQSVTPVASANGQVTLRGTASVPIIGDVTADANVGARDGKVVVSGAGLLDSFLHVTVWSSPKVYVESISGQPTSTGMTLSARGRLK